MKRILVLILASISLNGWSCPDDIGEKLYSILKTKIEWVDVNRNHDALTLTIRYYPCFSERIALDLLINKAMEGLSNCKVLKPGQHQLVENYCMLKDIEIGS